MKVVYLHQYFNSPSDAGGGRSYEMALRLVERGHEVHIVSSERSGDPAGTQWSVQKVDGIHVHMISVPYSNSMSFRQRIVAFLNFATKAALRARSLRGDVVIATSTPLTIAIPGIFATWGRRTPMVFEVRDLWPEVPIALKQLRNPMLILAARLLEKMVYRRSRSVIALSPGMKDGVVRAGFPSDRVHVIPNASDVGKFTGHELAAARWREGLPWLADRSLVVHCGTMGLVNDVRYLVDVAASTLRLDDTVRFLTVGEGKEAKLVQKYAEARGVLGVNFFMLQAVPRAEIPIIFEACDISTCLVAPVRELENNSANKVFDTFAAGRPLAINYGGWQAELLAESGAGIRIAREPESAAAQLVEFLRDEQGILASRQASRQLAETTFSREILAAQFCNVLEGAAGAPSKVSAVR